MQRAIPQASPPRGEVVEVVFHAEDRPLGLDMDCTPPAVVRSVVPGWPPQQPPIRQGQQWCSI